MTSEVKRCHLLEVVGIGSAHASDHSTISCTRSAPRRPHPPAPTRRGATPKVRLTAQTRDITPTPDRSRPAPPPRHAPRAAARVARRPIGPGRNAPTTLPRSITARPPWTNPHRRATRRERPPPQRRGPSTRLEARRGTPPTPARRPARSRGAARAPATRHARSTTAPNEALPARHRPTRNGTSATTQRIRSQLPPAPAWGSKLGSMDMMYAPPPCCCQTLG